MTRRSAKLTIHEIPAQELAAAKAYCETMVRSRARRADTGRASVAVPKAVGRLALPDLDSLLA